MKPDLGISNRTAALAAGAGLLLMGVIAMFANFIVLEGMVVDGDAAATMNNIRDSQGLFRLGIGGFLIIAILDVVVAAALYVLLRPAAETLAMLVAALRLVYAGMLGISLLNLLVVAGVVDGSGSPAGVETGQQAAQVMLFLDAFQYGWLTALVVFGLHLVSLGYLIYRTRALPGFLGVLLMLAGVGYLVDSFAQVTMTNYADYQTLFLMIVTVLAMGEVLLAFWLLFRGGKASTADRTIPEPANAVEPTA